MSQSDVIHLPTRVILPTSTHAVEEAAQDFEKAKTSLVGFSCINQGNIGICVYLWCWPCISTVFCGKLLWWLIKLPFLFLYSVSCRWCLPRDKNEEITKWFCSTKCSKYAEDGFYNYCCCCDTSDATNFWSHWLCYCSCCIKKDRYHNVNGEIQHV